MEFLSNQEDRERLHKLQEYLDRGFLLHGSKKRLDIILPRQSNDTTPDRVAGNAFAVYGEENDVRIPILMALFAQKDTAQKSWHSSYHSTEKGFDVSGENCTFTDGFVHVLPRDSFEREGDESDNELISRVAVTPVDVVPVSPSILRFVDGLTINLQ